MRNTVLTASALAATILVSSVAMAADRGPSFEEREKAQQAAFQHQASFGYAGKSTSAAPSSFKIVYLGNLAVNQSAKITSAATSDKIAAAQASIDASTAAELRAHGVQIHNIVAAAKSFDGNTIYYVR